MDDGIETSVRLANTLKLLNPQQKARYDQHLNVWQEQDVVPTDECRLEIASAFAKNMDERNTAEALKTAARREEQRQRKAAGLPAWELAPTNQPTYQNAHASTQAPMRPRDPATREGEVNPGFDYNVDVLRRGNQGVSEQQSDARREVIDRPSKTSAEKEVANAEHEMTNGKEMTEAAQDRLSRIMGHRPNYQELRDATPSAGNQGPSRGRDGR